VLSAGGDQVEGGVFVFDAAISRERFDVVIGDVLYQAIIHAVFPFFNNIC
jgi:hypothetical protein